jgi:hypothetical protein
MTIYSHEVIVQFCQRWLVVHQSLRRRYLAGTGTEREIGEVTITLEELVALMEQMKDVDGHLVCSMHDPPKMIVLPTVVQAGTGLLHHVVKSGGPGIPTPHNAASLDRLVPGRLTPYSRLQCKWYCVQCNNAKMNLNRTQCGQMGAWMKRILPRYEEGVIRFGPPPDLSTQL